MCRIGITGLFDQFVEAQLCQEPHKGEEARDARLQRRRHLLERAGADIGDGGGQRKRERSRSVGRDLACRPSALEKGGGEPEWIAARN